MKQYLVKLSFTLCVSAENEEDAKGKAIDEYTQNGAYIGYEGIDSVDNANNPETELKG